MKLTKWKAAAAGVAVGGVVAFGALLSAGGASAQGPSDPSGDGSGVSRYETLLAQQLGISVDQLKTDQKTAYDQAIDEAAASGRITSDQAAKLKSMEPGVARRHFLRSVGGGVRHRLSNVLDAAAKTIGVSKDDAKSELQSGKSLAQIAGEHNVTADQLKAGITTEVQSKLDAAVKNGTLTQVQADKLSGGLSQRLDKLINRTGGGHQGAAATGSTNQ